MSPMTRPLLDRRFAPATDVMGFIEAPLEACVRACRTLLASLLDLDATAVERRQVGPGLASALAELVAVPEGRPGGGRPSRLLLAPTAAPSWTALFFGDGVDHRRVLGDLPDLLDGRAVTAYCEGDDDEGVVGFTLAAPGRAGMLDAVRVLIVERRSAAPEVQTYGDPLPGEPAEPASLDLDGLAAVLRTFGIAAFDTGFYLPPGTDAVLLEPASPATDPTGS
jgi:hypothetical protein